MTNLMCRGRKRGLAGVIATQRLAKLAKNVAAEASNFLMGRTFLDIDMARAADLLGHGAAPGRGDPRPAARHLPRARPGDRAAPGGGGDRRGRHAGALDEPQADPARRAGRKSPATAVRARRRAARAAAAAARRPRRNCRRKRCSSDGRLDPVARAEPLPAKSDDEAAAIIADVLRAIVDDETSGGAIGFGAVPGLHRALPDGGAAPGRRSTCADFTRRLSMARAGIYDVADEAGHGALDAARALPDDMLGPFLLVARAARDGAPCPSDEAIAASYGTASLGRARRLIQYIESRELIVSRTDLSGKRSIAIPSLGWATASA